MKQTVTRMPWLERYAASCTPDRAPEGSHASPVRLVGRPSDIYADINTSLSLRSVIGYSQYEIGMLREMAKAMGNEDNRLGSLVFSEPREELELSFGIQS